MGIARTTLNFTLGAFLGLLVIILETTPAFTDVGAEQDLEDALAILGLFVVVIILTLGGIGIWYLLRGARREK